MLRAFFFRIPCIPCIQWLWFYARNHGANEVSNFALFLCSCDFVWVRNSTSYEAGTTNPHEITRTKPADASNIQIHATQNTRSKAERESIIFQIASTSSREEVGPVIGLFIFGT